MKRIVSLLGICLCIVFSAQNSLAETTLNEVMSKLDVNLYGRVKFDVHYDTVEFVNYNDFLGTVKAGDDFENNSVNFNPRDTRFGLAVSHDEEAWLSEGRVELDFYGTNSGNNIIPLSFKAEPWVGEGIDNEWLRYDLGVNTSGTTPEEIFSWGGFVSAAYDATDKVSFATGYGVDNPDDGDLEGIELNDRQFALNQYVFLNTWYKLTEVVKVGAEVIYIRTSRGEVIMMACASRLRQSSASKKGGEGGG